MIFDIMPSWAVQGIRRAFVVPCHKNVTVLQTIDETCNIVSSYNESFSLGFTSYAFDHYKKDIMLHMQMPLRFTPPLDGEEGVG